MTGATEKQLIADYYAGDDRAYELLFDEYFPRLRRFFARMGLVYYDEDLAAETLFRVARTRGRNAEYDGRTSFSTWIYFIARREALRHIETRPATTSFDLDLIDKLLAERSDVALSQALESLNSTIERMPDNLRKVIELSIGGLTMQEIADSTGSSLSTTKRNLGTARHFLKDALGE